MNIISLVLTYKILHKVVRKTSLKNIKKCWLVHKESLMKTRESQVILAE